MPSRLRFVILRRGDLAYRPLRRAAAPLLLLIAALIGSVPVAGAAALPTTAARPALSAAPASAQVLTRFATNQPVIALTFDCGSDRGYASQILDVAKAKGVKLTFGMTGLWAQSNPDLVRRMVAEGHQLINHTWDHQSFTGYSTGTAPLSAAQIASELNRTDSLVFSQTGTHLAPYFRPPYGDSSAAALQAAAADGYQYSVMWTVDSLGWEGLSIPALTQRVIDGAEPGAIILMHVGEGSLDGPALGGIIDQLRAKGYRFATIADFVEGRTQPQTIYFPQTGHSISHGFLRYWQQFGGLTAFGYPIGDEFQENGTTVQYFERARFEWHPGTDPARYDVLLGLLGDELTAGRRAAGEAPFQPIKAASDASCTYYAETGHRLCNGFRIYWQQHGGLAILGYPISEEFQENGVTVQYFERQRLEWHPENKLPYDILGGLLGSQLYAARH